MEGFDGYYLRATWVTWKLKFSFLDVCKTSVCGDFEIVRRYLESLVEYGGGGKEPYFTAHSSKVGDIV